MNLSAIISQLKANATIFGGRVAGAGELAIADEQRAWLATPCAYVCPVEEAAGDNEVANGLYQRVTEKFCVLICLDNASDRRSQTSVSNLPQVRAAIFGAILNWRLEPEVSPRGIEYVGGSRNDSDRARFWFEYQFSHETLITDADGWQEPRSPLIEIDVAVQDTAGGTLADTHIIIEQ